MSWQKRTEDKRLDDDLRRYRMIARRHWLGCSTDYVKACTRELKRTSRSPVANARPGQLPRSLDDETAIGSVIGPATFVRKGWIFRLLCRRSGFGCNRLGRGAVCLAGLAGHFDSDSSSRRPCCRWASDNPYQERTFRRCCGRLSGFFTRLARKSHRWDRNRPLFGA